MTMAQPAILNPLPQHSRYLSFSLDAGVDPQQVLERLQVLKPDPNWVIGLGVNLVDRIGGSINGLKPFPSYTSQGIEIPSTQHALWIWLSGDDRGTLLHQGRQLIQLLIPEFRLESNIEGFKHREGRDLTGYIDGTENPEGEEAVQAAICNSEGLQGSSFVAVQRWLHHMDRFEAMTQPQKDDSIGRRLSDNVEFPEAPPSAHVKRTAQESFTPEAFLLRRSLPWIDAHDCGLMFIAFGHSFAAFEAQLERMIGLEDGVADGLFQFTQPVTGGYYWCPPLREGRLDLSALK